MLTTITVTLAHVSSVRNGIASIPMPVITPLIGPFLSSISFMIRSVTNCGTAAVISPISKIDDLETGKSYVFGDKPGPVSEKLFNKLRNIQYGIEPDTHNWTRVVIG